MLDSVAANGSEHRIAVKAVHQFPSAFTQSNLRANREKPRRWWSSRNEVFSALQTSNNDNLSFSATPQKGPAVRRYNFKALSGCGIRRTIWKNVMHQVLKDEFVRCKAAGIKINHQVLREIALNLVHDPSVPCTQQEIEQDTGKCLSDNLSLGWVCDFCARYTIKV